LSSLQNNFVHFAGHVKSSDYLYHRSHPIYLTTKLETIFGLDSFSISFMLQSRINKTRSVNIQLLMFLKYEEGHKKQIVIPYNVHLLKENT